MPEVQHYFSNLIFTAASDARMIVILTLRQVSKLQLKAVNSLAKGRTRPGIELGVTHFRWATDFKPNKISLWPNDRQDSVRQSIFIFKN